MKEEGKLPPQSLEFEECVLGAAMLEKDGTEALLRLLNENVFYLKTNAEIFKAIKQLSTDKAPVDIITVTQQLQKNGKLKDVGGTYRITMLTDRVASAANIEYHCRIILQQFFRRQLIDLGRKITNISFDDSQDVFDTMDYIKIQLKEIESYLASEKIITNDVIIDQVIQDISIAESKGGIIGESTSIPSLDLALLGLRPGLKYVIAALPGVGKTSLAKTICIHLAQSGVPGIFFSMEMSKTQIMMSCISQILNIPNVNIQQGRVSPLDMQRIEDIKKSLFSKHFFIDDRSALSPQEMRTTVKRFVEDYGIKWIAIDHIGKMKLKGKEHNSKSKEQMVSEIASENKNLAKDFDLIVFELSQLTKETMKNADKRPNLGNLRDTGAIEAEADVVMFVYRPEKHGITEINDGDSSEGFAEIIIAKQRFGPPMSVACRYVGATTTFKAHEAVQVLEISNNHVF
jgi:replicative DNA helicase